MNIHTSVHIHREDGIVFGVDVELESVTVSNITDGSYVTLHFDDAAHMLGLAKAITDAVGDPQLGVIDTRPEGFAE